MTGVFYLFFGSHYKQCERKFLLHLYYSDLIEQRSISNKPIILQLSSAKVLKEKCKNVYMQVWLASC